MKTKLYIILAVIISGFGYSQDVVYIPDQNFKNALLNHYPVIDTNNDGEIQKQEAFEFTQDINVSNKNISDLTGIEAFENIQYLYCFNNQLTALDVTYNNLLKGLYCQNNQLTTLTLSTCLPEQSQNCYQKGPDLIYLYCQNNQLTSLYVHPQYQSYLEALYCQNNQLTALELKYISINHLTNSFNSTNNPNLTCIELNQWNIDFYIPIWADKIDSWTTLSDDCASLELGNVYIPDQNFKNCLLSNLDINTNGNQEISVAEAMAFTGTIYTSSCSGNIYDLTGIEAFVNITGLSLYQSQLTSLDLSNNTALITLDCSNNLQLTSLNISNNTALTMLTCQNNAQLTSLNLSNNTALTHLSCGLNSQLTSIDLSNNTALIFLDCSGGNPSFQGQFTNLDLSNNTALTSLICYNHQLTSLDLSNNTALISLGCSNNQLTSLDLSNNTALINLVCSNNPLQTLNVSNCTALKYLTCDYSNLTSLDLSNNIVLIRLKCENNYLLSSLDLRNGNNYKMATIVGEENGRIEISSNPQLFCVDVDDPIFSYNYWKSLPHKVDSNTEFSEDCSGLNFVYIPDPTFKHLLLINSQINVVSDNEISVPEALNFTGTIDINGNNGNIIGGQQIYDLTGIEAFVNIKGFVLKNTSVSMLDLSNNTALESIECENNQFLTGINIKNGNNVNLIKFKSFNNPILTCIQVDDANWSNTNWVGNQFQKDPWATYNENCGYVSINDFKFYDFSYYPNPVNDVLHFSSNQAIEKISIRNLLGQEVKANLSSDNTNIDLSDLPSGNYFVKVTIEGVSKTIKIIKN